jgi:hypothetical protein
VSAADALAALAAELRAQGAPIAPHVVSCAEQPTLGLLAAEGRESAGAQYALIVEAVREGYLLHYGEPRLLAGYDADLALLAGDFLYALAIERLCALGDAEAIAELADLISLCAQLQSEGRAGSADQLWRASARTIGAGPSGSHEAFKRRLRAGEPD